MCLPRIIGSGARREEQQESAGWLTFVENTWLPFLCCRATEGAEDLLGVSLSLRMRPRRCCGRRGASCLPAGLQQCPGLQLGLLQHRSFGCNHRLVPGLKAQPSFCYCLSFVTEGLLSCGLIALFCQKLNPAYGSALPGS